MKHLLASIGHGISALSRGVNKRRAIRRVWNSPALSNTGVVNVHRHDPSNVGDYFCAPHHYFERLQDRCLDIYDYKRDSRELREHWIEQVRTAALIIGGGGLLNHHAFEVQMRLFEHLGARGKKTVLWGVGHNSHRPTDFGTLTGYNVDLSRFGLAGVRDHWAKNRWVPCVSCLHPIFDAPFRVERELGLVLHKKTSRRPEVLQRFSGLPSTTNDSAFEDVVGFIGETDTILTDSYHAMYWSLLLGKKVMVFPNSSKFFDFKYSPVISSFDRFRDDLSKLRRYTGVLEECRQANLSFAEKVFDYLDA